MLSARTRRRWSGDGEYEPAPERLEGELADVAYTLQVGRKGFGKRCALVSGSVAEARTGLGGPAGLISSAAEVKERPVIFMFPGQGSQYEGMGWDLYQEEKVFREEVERCSQRLEGELGLDLRSVLYPGQQWGDAGGRLHETALTQPALFVTEYALARLWQSWGIQAQGMIGHSIGEYVAACLAGVFTLEEALEVVALRGRLMQAAGSGRMLAVNLSGEQAQNFLAETKLELSLAAENGLQQSVLSGAAETIEQAEQQLSQRGIKAQRLETGHAFHSALMAGAAEQLEQALRQVKLRAPTVPYLSNVSGTWIERSEATDPKYWSRQLRQTVRFGAGLAEVLKLSEPMLLEVGPGRTLSNLAMGQVANRWQVSGVCGIGRKNGPRAGA